MSRTAVVLFNLGGPDRREAVRPFLYNLFSDPAIIGLPRPLRMLVAWLIAARRAPVAAEIYGKLGGGSPILPNTRAQAIALETALGPDYRCFIAMRYWHPLSEETAKAVRDWNPDRVVLLPLYPQYSSTTTASSLKAWREAAAGIGLAVPTSGLCCYPAEQGFIAGLTGRIHKALSGLPEGQRYRVLFSAHGLPKKVVRGGDPYQWQVERTVDALRRALAIPDLDSVICYQSRVGPLEWIGPATTAEILRAGAEKTAVVIVPVAFVSEHSETLVELDIEYRHLAESSGVPAYLRVPTVDAAAEFIAGLALLVRGHVEEAESGKSRRERFCPAKHGLCGFADMQAERAQKS